MGMIIGLICALVGFSTAWLFLGRSKGVPKEQYDALWKEKTDLGNKVLELTKDASRLEAEKGSLQERLDAGKSELENFHIKFEEHFKNLAQGILDSQSVKFQECGKESIKAIVDPLKENLQELQKSVIEAKSLNQNMTQETKSLVLALRGDSTTQGRWGEIVLEKILERSGLRAGEEYIVQGKGLGLKGGEGETQKPDVVINIPDPDKPKHIVIDSKVSLTAYDAYINTADSETREPILEKYLSSVREHINGLSGKKYDVNEKLSTPDFVLMFIPIEGAFALALQSDAELFPKAWDKNIVIVSPTTLLATLRTVAALWRQERGSKNVLKIAEQAGNLYDKFEGLLQDLQEIGNKLKGAQTSYDDAMNKIKTGRGNLIDKVEFLKTLGAKASKQINPKFIQDAKDSENDQA